MYNHSFFNYCFTAFVTFFLGKPLLSNVTTIEIKPRKYQVKLGLSFFLLTHVDNSCFYSNK